MLSHMSECSELEVGDPSDNQHPPGCVVKVVNPTECTSASPWDDKQTPCGDQFCFTHTLLDGKNVYCTFVPVLLRGALINTAK